MGKGKLWLLLVIVGLILAACAPKATPVAPMPVEATPTLSPAAILGPQPGATFSGPIEISGKASSGTISFTVSEDGASITNLSITLNDVTCEGLSVGRIHDVVGGLLVPIANGEFSTAIPAMGAAGISESENYSLNTSPFAFPTVASLDNVGQTEGEFTSATQASGTIRVYMWAVMTDRACELGTFSWRAEAP